MIHYFWNLDLEFYIATLILRYLNCEVSRRILKCEKDFRYILESRNHLYGKRKWTNKLQKFCAIISYLHKMHPCERDFEENFWIAWLFGHNAQKYGLCAFDFASYQRIENILSGLWNERSHWRTQYISWLIFFFYEVLKLVEKKTLEI